MRSSKEDSADFEQRLAAMTPRSRDYAIVRRELQKRGRWKYKVRGKPFSKGHDPNRKA